MGMTWYVLSRRWRCLHAASCWKMSFMMANSCSIRWSRRRSSPPLTRKQYSRSSLPRILRRLGLRIEDITSTWHDKKLHPVSLTHHLQWKVAGILNMWFSALCFENFSNALKFPLGECQRMRSGLYVEIGLGNEPLLEPMLTHIFVAIWCH